jgi:inosine/xanthosine triphosphate pyrophosphatase family protein
MKVLIATGNPAKIQAYTELLSEFNIEVETLASLDIKDSFEELGQTFIITKLLKSPPSRRIPVLR